MANTPLLVVADTSTVSATTSNGVFAMLNYNAGVTTPWLEVKKVGNMVGMYYSEDGINYVLAQEVDFAASPWGPTTYLGIDLINTTTLMGAANGTFDEVNFMGTAGRVDLSTTELALSGGTRLSLDFFMTVSQVFTNGVALEGGCWGSSFSPANHVDDGLFQGAGMAVAGLPPLSLSGVADMIVAATVWYGAEVTYPAPTATGGTAPYVISSDPPSGSTFPLGTNTVTCTITDSSCLPQTKYGQFKIIVLSPTPEMTLSRFSRPGGVATFEIPNSVWGFQYTLVYKDDLAAGAWTPLDGTGTYPGIDDTITLSDPTPIESLPPHRFYRVLVNQ